MSQGAPSFDMQLRLLPGRPHRSVVEGALRRLVRHAEPPITLVGIAGGEALPADDPEGAFGAFWERTDDTAVEITLKRPGGALVLLVRDGVGGAEGSVSLTSALEPSLTDGFVELLVHLSDLLASPLSVLSHRAPGRERAGWASRVGSHQAAVRKAAEGEPWTYALACGLAGVAYRMVLGPELVTMFGEERLGRLPSSQGERRGDGRWVLATTADPLDWTFERWCPEEAALIEVLGTEHFFDPETGRLPSVTPRLARHAPYRCSYVEPATGERVEYDPDQE